MSQNTPDAPYYDFNPYNLPQEYLTAIGLVTASAAQTEAVIQDAIAGFLKTNTEYGAALTTHMQMPLRFNVLTAIAEIVIDDLDALDELDDLIDAAEKAFVLRNSIVHHKWCREVKTNDVFTVKESARGTVKRNLIPMRIDQIKADARAIYDAGMNLYTFLMDRKFLPAYSPLSDRSHKSKAVRKKRREAILAAQRSNDGTKIG